MDYHCPQTFNDKWLIESFFKGMRNGFFIEAGGADGISESSSYTLEKDFGWRGIILEPCREFYEQLIKIRESKCFRAALSDTDGKATFITAKDKFYSGLSESISDWHKDTVYKEGFIEEEVETISAKSLLQNNNCPAIIDYIALDMEGSELQVLKAFPFNQYLVKLFIIEISDVRIRELMFENGFLELKNHFNTESPWENYFLNRKIVNTALHP
jgi:FkbM family methyltransferase